MALPAGISTATLTAGVPVSFAGGAIQSIVTIKPSAFLVHIETGTPLVDMLEEAATPEGVAAQFILPHTDQDGFQDENGNAYKNWYYTATIQYVTGKATHAPKTKVFQLATGQTLVDIDKLPGGAPAMPYTAPVAGVTSVNGQTGSVLVGGVTDEALEAIISDSESATATALNATYAQQWKPATAYVAGQAVVNPSGESVTALASHTSGASFNPANWVFLKYVQLAKNPDTLIAGAVTLDGSDQVTSAVVAWPDGSPGALTITARHATGAVNAYNITYGSPVTKTFTQPTITRNANGAATNVPQIVVS